MSSSRDNGVEVYSGTARRFHWWTVALLAVQVPVGIAMVYRGKTLNVWDALTNNLYSLHKLLGVIILVVVLARLAYRVVHGTPRPEPTITVWQREASELNHTWLYALLIVTPILGWLGVSLYGALEIFGLFSLPGLAAQNQDAANYVFLFHVAAASLLVALIAVHVAAALYHRLVRKDGVLSRMLPGRKQP